MASTVGRVKDFVEEHADREEEKREQRLDIERYKRESVLEIDVYLKLRARPRRMG